MASLSRGRVLTVQGIHVDIVSERALALSQAAPLSPRLDEFAHMVRYDSEPQGHYVTGGTVKEAFWRTMLNEALETKPNKHVRLTEDDETIFALWWDMIRNENGLLLDPNDFPSLDQGVIASIQAQLRIINQSFWLPNDNRAFFTTQRGYMGFGPPDMRQGDLVAILAGSRMPFVLREAPMSEGTYDKSYYTVVGYCCLHGVMNGEVTSDNVDYCNINLV